MQVVPSDILDVAVETARQYGATELVLFGSSLEPSNGVRDLDLACRGVAGWDRYRLGAALEERLPMQVDLVPLDTPSRFGGWIESHGRRLL